MRKETEVARRIKGGNEKERDRFSQSLSLVEAFGPFTFKVVIGDRGRS